MGPLSSTTCSTLVALGAGLTLGLLLGRVALEWLAGRGVTTLLVEARGGLLPVVIAPLVVGRVDLPPWLTIGLLVGASRAVAVARWIGRPSNEWSPALRGGLALGRSGALLHLRMARSRGGVVGTLALAPLEVVMIELLVSKAAEIPFVGLGVSLHEGSTFGSTLWVTTLLAVTLAGELALRRLLRGPEVPGHPSVHVTGVVDPGHGEAP